MQPFDITDEISTVVLYDLGLLVNYQHYHKLLRLDGLDHLMTTTQLDKITVSLKKKKREIFHYAVKLKDVAAIFLHCH